MFIFYVIKISITPQYVHPHIPKLVFLKYVKIFESRRQHKLTSSLQREGNSRSPPKQTEEKEEL